ncbi:hypothetical protein ACSHWC_20690 [Pseudomonas fluorescens]
MFLLNEYEGTELGPLHVFDKGFMCVPGKKYSGFLGLNIDRVKMVSIVVALRRKGLEVFSSSVRYRDISNIDIERATKLASDYSATKGFHVVYDPVWSMKDPPVFWSFRIVSTGEVRVGGAVMIDKVDGHVWSDTEYLEYLYDYNNIL